MDVVGEYLGGYVVVDHKTTGFINAMWTDQWAMDGQVTGYIWAARQLLRDKPVMGAFINGVQFSKLPNDGTRKCKDHGVKYAECGPMHAKWEVVGLLERNAVMVENWLAEAVPMAEGLYRLWRYFARCFYFFSQFLIAIFYKSMLRLEVQPMKLHLLRDS